MRMTIKAHFDGRYIVPKEALSLPVDKPLDVVVMTVETDASTAGLEADPAKREAIWEAMTQRAKERNLPSPPDHALDRESIYEHR